jgi:peptidoglycan/LPS O-acetylase OafA/YrhL
VPPTDRHIPRFRNVTKAVTRRKRSIAMTIKTMGHVHSQCGGFAPGFDFMRVALALSVLAYHCVEIIEGNFIRFWATPGWFMDYAILPMFFSLSGYLIAASATRLKLKDFLINRGLRILPALAVEVVLSAVVLGGIFTTLPKSEYYLSSDFWHYFTNIIGWVNFYLPGVFKDHPETSVNNSLWTIPWEIMCYGIMSALIITSVIKKQKLHWLVPAAAVFLWLGYLIFQDFVFRNGPAEGALFHALHHVFVFRGNVLLITFVLGIATYLYRDYIPYSWPLFWVCALACAAAACFLPAAWQWTPLSTLILAPILVYITMFLGLTRLPKLPFYSTGDYSYGIYLYGMPVQQTLYELFHFQSELMMLLWSAVFSTLFAALSWHFVEKRVLRLRRKFSFVARQRLDEQREAAVPVTARSQYESMPKPDQPTLDGRV